MRFYSILLAHLLFSTTLSAQNEPIDMNDHQAVIQTIATSPTPLATWQHMVEHSTPQATEQAADAVLAWIQHSPAHTVYVPLLKHWQNHRPVTTRPSDEHGHEVGLYLIAARATGELNRLLSEQTERYIYALADSQPHKLLTELTDLHQQNHPAITSGIKTALKHLTAQQQQMLINQQLQSHQVSAISPMLAVELDSSSIQKKIALSKQPEVIDALIQAWQHNPPDSTQWLRVIVQKPGPHQIRALGLYRHFALNNEDETWLISLLKDATLGRTAARVLGQHNNPQLVNNLYNKWLNSNTEPLATNLLYALSRNPLGLKKLKTMRQKKSNSLTDNQQQWLNNQLGDSHEK